jgi:D-methionine transport system ATP-binding protein
MITFKHVSKSFNETTVLNNISFIVQENEIYGIIGKSGAGKSTLLRLINGLILPSSGSIYVNDILLDKEKDHLKTIRHNTGMIFQHFNLLNTKNVYDNIALPLRIQHMDEKEMSKRVNELLQLVSLEDKKYEFPAQLSGGQKQRVAIARALSFRPKILLCDEATSALDPETTQTILSLLKKINQYYGITILLITHQMDVIKQICHRVGYLEKGELIENYTLASIFSYPQSKIANMLFQHLSPHIPDKILQAITPERSNKSIVRLFFQGDVATMPFISQISQSLQININILLANMDIIDTITYGVLIVELTANEDVLQLFIESCQQATIFVEILGYATDPLV